MFLDYFGYWLYNILFVFALYLIIAKRDYIVKHKREVLLILITLLFYSQYRRYGARLFTPLFEYSIDTLPIHFCRFSALMTLVYFITKNKFIKGFVYFQSGLGILSVLIPGGYFFIMTQEWRSFTYMVDHFILAIMPFFLIFIDGYKVNRRDLIISTTYSVVVPLAVLPWALATNYNAYYVLDGVFLKDIVGDNQTLIMVYMLVLLVLYNFLMYVAGQALENWSQKTYKESKHLFKPTYPWYVLGGIILTGIIVGVAFVRPVPAYLKTNANAYMERPVAVYSDDLVVYAGVGNNNEIFYFFEVLQDDVELEVYNADADEIIPALADDLVTRYIDSTDIGKTNILIFLITNDGQADETVEVLNLTVINDHSAFMDEYGNNLTYND